MKWCWKLSKDFSASIEMIQCFFVFDSINMLYYIYRFAYVEPHLHPWDEADLVMLDDLSDVLLDLVCHYLLGIFALMFIKEVSLSVIGMTVILPS
jgi:hypothetical protein